MKLSGAGAAAETELKRNLPAEVFRETEPRYLEEPHNRFTGHAGLVLAPSTVDEVSTIIRFASENRVPVIPYGGGTGLVGGQITADYTDPIVLSLERMNKIRAVYPSENIIIAEAGAILGEVQSAAEEVNRLFPLSLAAEGSARIGGNLATNAGGLNVLRYGNARDLCLGLEAVLPDGSIWNGLSRLRKDNTGYDLRNLLVGSEGTLGIITAASLKLFPRPAREGTAFVIVPSPDAAIELLSIARDIMGEGISAFELINGQGLEFLEETLPNVRQPFDPKPEWSVLIEAGLSGGLDPVQVLEKLFESAAEKNLVSDGLVAQSKAQSDDFWAVREQMPEANRLIGAIFVSDISIPISLIPDFVSRAIRAVSELGDFRVNCFGHLGDGNLHYNVYPPAGKSRSDYQSQRDEIKTAILDIVQEMHGSISAEHGIGRLKVSDLERYGDPVKLASMRSIKAALDPVGIMNPGVMLRR